MNSLKLAQSELIPFHGFSGKLIVAPTATELVESIVNLLENYLRGRLSSTKSKPIGLATGRTMEPIYSSLLARRYVWRFSLGRLIEEINNQAIKSSIPLNYLSNLSSRKSSMSWLVTPFWARSAMISPITLANLNPWPEKPAATETWGWSGNTPIINCSSGVLV